MGFESAVREKSVEDAGLKGGEVTVGRGASKPQPSESNRKRGMLKERAYGTSEPKRCAHTCWARLLTSLTPDSSSAK